MLLGIFQPVIFINSYLSAFLLLGAWLFGAITSRPTGTMKASGQRGDIRGAVRRSKGLVSRIPCGTCARTYYDGCVYGTFQMNSYIS